MMSVFRSIASDVELSNLEDLFFRHLKAGEMQAVPRESNTLYVRVLEGLSRKGLQKELGLLFWFS